MARDGIGQRGERHMHDEWEHARSLLREAGVAGWKDLGLFVNNTDALVTCAQVADLPTLLDLAAERRYGWSRQMVVDALWRFKKDDRVGTLLLQLIDDPDVALHAMGALRRVLGNGDALPHLRRVRDAHPERRVREQAKQQVRRAESKANRQTVTQHGAVVRSAGAAQDSPMAFGGSGCGSACGACPHRTVG